MPDFYVCGSNLIESISQINMITYNAGCKPTEDVLYKNLELFGVHNLVPQLYNTQWKESRQQYTGRICTDKIAIGACKALFIDRPVRRAISFELLNHTAHSKFEYRVP
jgi:hypothetical protein